LLAWHLDFDAEEHSLAYPEYVGDAGLLVFVAVYLPPLAAETPAQPFQDTPDEPSLWLLSHQVI